LPEPARSARNFSGDVIHEGATAENGVGVEPLEILQYPEFLPRHSHADQQNVRFEALDLVQNLTIRGPTCSGIEIAVPSLNLYLWIL
jgi:hypothetical protein